VRLAPLANSATGSVILVLVSVIATAALQKAQTPAGAVTGGCHVSPVVSDLERSANFYHNLIGLDLVPEPGSMHLRWDRDPSQLNLHGLSKGRVRFIDTQIPGLPCGVELVEFADSGQRSVRRRLQDPGAAMLILLVRDIDAIFSRLKAAHATVLTRGGVPILVGPSKTARAVIVEDPDGHPIELAQLQPAAPATTAADSNILGIRLRITVTNSEKAAIYYRQTLGIDAQPGVFTKDESVMAMMGFPATGEYRVGTSTLSGSSLVLELIEFKGVGETRSLQSRIQDPGSYRLHLEVRDIDETLSTLKQYGSHVISTHGSPVRMTLGSNPWRIAVVQDPNNLFLVVQQRLTLSP